MREKLFLRIIIGGICLFISIIAGLNYWIDYYAVFRGIHQDIIRNDLISERFIKVDYLLHNSDKQRYDSFLWGSSRVQKMDPWITGERTYNMGESVGVANDCLHDLMLLLEDGYRPKTIYLGIDNTFYTADWGEITTRSLFRVPYSASIEQRTGYYMTLFMNLNTLYLGFKDKFDIQSERAQTLLNKNGMYLIPQSIENEVENDPHGYVQLEKFQVPILAYSGNTAKTFSDCLYSIRQVKQLCDANGIQFVPFFNPQHMTTYLADDMELMNRFKKELVKISPFWDFSGVNYVTANNYFWYETSHPRAFICDKILDTVSGQNQITWVPDFGVYVTPENVDAFCEKAVRDRAAYDPNHEQWIPSPEERKIMTKRVNY